MEGVHVYQQRLVAFSSGFLACRCVKVELFCKECIVGRNSYVILYCAWDYLLTPSMTS